eukprot:2411578-Rhodomonas_salina.1
MDNVRTRSQKRKVSTWPQKFKLEPGSLRVREGFRKGRAGHRHHEQQLARLSGLRLPTVTQQLQGCNRDKPLSCSDSLPSSTSA